MKNNGKLYHFKQNTAKVVQEVGWGARTMSKLGVYCCPPFLGQGTCPFDPRNDVAQKFFFENLFTYDTKLETGLIRLLI